MGQSRHTHLRARATRWRWLAAALLPLASTPFACASDGAPTARGNGSVVTSTEPERPGRLDIVAENYRWSGLPDQLPAGSYPLTLRNDGTEVHEIQVFKNTETLSLAELHALGPVDLKDHVQLAGGVIVGPGTASAETVLRLDPGTYEVVCFLPAATDRRPHFDHGMHRTLVVTRG